MTSDTSRWDPPREVAFQAPVQRVAFGLACAEHLYPSFARQVQTHPSSLPSAALSPETYRACVDALWQWLRTREGAAPDCVTESQVLAAESSKSPHGLLVLVEDPHVVLWYATAAYDDPRRCIDAGRRALETTGEIAEVLLGPRPAPVTISEDKRLFKSWREAVARHEAVQAERAAQAEAVAVLAAGVDPADLREPAQAVGARIAEWAAEVL